MNIDKFPNLPTDGETLSYNGRTYTFVKDDNGWYSSNVTQPIDNTIVTYHSYGMGIQIYDKIEDINNDVVWAQIRLLRDQKIQELDWRYIRYNRLQRLNLPQIDDITKLDAYGQALADITKQGDLFNFVWPTL
jgi:hypothetical protein